MRLLLVEDDQKIAALIVKGFKQAGFAIDLARNAEDALNMAVNVKYDAGVVDIMLPGRDGLSFIDELRKKKIQTPLIILSAKKSVHDRIKGLETGSDDYLVKPFSFAELHARIQALIRRASTIPESTHLEVAELFMDLSKRRVVRAGQTIELQPREFSLLEYLMRNAGRVVSKTMIMEHVWDYSFDPQTNVVDVLVHRLRKKMDSGFSDKLIHTIRGVGYVLKHH